MTHDDVAIVNLALRGQREIDARFLESVARLAGVETPEVRALLRSTLRELGSEVPASYALQTGTWKLDLDTALLKAAACGLVMTLVLQRLGVHDISPTVLSVVAPFLFELERIELHADDLWVHGRLLAVAGTDALKPRNLYKRLPAKVKHEITYRELLVILERLKDAGIAGTTDDDRVTLSPVERSRRFRIVIE